MLAALRWLASRALVALVMLWGLGVCWYVWQRDKDARELRRRLALRRRVPRSGLMVAGGGLRRVK